MFDEDIDRVNKTWGAYIMDLEELAKANDYEATASANLIGACREVGDGTRSPFLTSPMYLHFSTTSPSLMRPV